MWPDFAEADLAAAVSDFQGRVRRFGALPDSAEPAALPAAAVLTRSGRP